MGEVTAVSGDAILGRKIMDWAFVQPTDTTAEAFFRPNVMFPVPPDKMPWLYSPNLGISSPKGTPITEVGDLEKGQYYLKLGPSTV